MIYRRDFLNGVLTAAGGAAVLGMSPLRAFADAAKAGVTAVGPDQDPRFLRGGNAPNAFNIGHWLRDGRIRFTTPGKIYIQESPLDGARGEFPISAEDTWWDLVVVGAGLSGLSAAYFFLKERPDAKVLLLDANTVPGGNAGRDDLPPLTGAASTGGAYAVEPYSDLLKGTYADIGLAWEKYIVPEPFYSYYFDDRTPHVKPGTKGWVVDAYGKNAGKLPYSEAVNQNLLAAKADFLAWYDKPGSPTDPADASDVMHDGLAGKTLDAYLREDKGFHPAVSDFFTRFTVDALGGTTEQVNAHSGISFLGAEYHALFAPPGGTHEIVRRILRKVIGASVPVDMWKASALPVNALDRSGANVRIRQNAIALHVDTKPDEGTVTYFAKGAFHRVRARAVILAGQGHTGRRMADGLFDDEQRSAWDQFARVPVIVANVALRNAEALTSLGLGYNQYWWGSQYWADFVIADWVTPQRKDPKRPVTLTFYGGNERPASELAAERLKLMSTPFGDYEQSLRDDLSRVLAGSRFDFSRDVLGIYLYRWGHGMLMPTPGFTFGTPVQRGGKWERTLAARHVARRQVGRVSFAGQDVEGSPSVESAISSGQRTAFEALRT